MKVYLSKEDLTAMHDADAEIIKLIATTKEITEKKRLQNLSRGLQNIRRKHEERESKGY